MKVNVLIFGQLTDITGTATLTCEDVTDTSMLTGRLHASYPLLASKKYRLAVNTTLVNENTLLTDDCTVALLPPFSGG